MCQTKLTFKSKIIRLYKNCLRNYILYRKFGCKSNNYYTGLIVILILKCFSYDRYWLRIHKSFQYYIWLPLTNSDIKSEKFTLNQLTTFQQFRYQIKKFILNQWLALNGSDSKSEKSFGTYRLALNDNLDTKPKKFILNQMTKF